MKKVTALLSALLLCSGGVSAAIYKSIDANGNVVYSDEPSKNAQQLTLPPLSVIPSLSQNAIHTALTAPEANTNTPSMNAVRAGRYNLTFISPLPDQNIRKPEPLNVNVAVTPGLTNADAVSILLDGVVVAQGASAAIPTENIDRGTHRLSARVMSAAGRIVGENSVMINIQQTSVNNSPALKAVKAK